MIGLGSPAQNRLLALLSPTERERFYPKLELVSLPLSKVLIESGRRSDHVFFPTTAIVSVVFFLENGGSTEVAVIGKEGMAGVTSFMSGDATPSQCVVQSAGFAYRCETSQVKQEFAHAGGLYQGLLRYTQALFTLMGQTALCNRHHSVSQQLCRWLLLSLDRLPSNDLQMTQKLIADMLGVRREGVTEAAGKLQSAGVIRYSRGRITVLDRPRLESMSCECYKVVKREFDQMLPTGGLTAPEWKIPTMAQSNASSAYFRR